MNRNKVLNVHIDGCLVGTMAETADHRYAFAYDKQWIKNGYPISPFSLPLEEQVFVPANRTFHGLWGVFAVSYTHLDVYKRQVPEQLVLRK